MGTFPGFPPGFRSLPVPAPLLGPLLEEISDIAELKCTLRYLWFLAQQKGMPRAVKAADLLNDPVLITTLGSKDAIQKGLKLAADRGTLLAAATPTGEALYFLNTPVNRRLAASMRKPSESGTYKADDEAHDPGPKPNVFALYEESIGPLSPMIAEELKDAEATYPMSWIEDAFREALAQNKRSWRYIARILERWSAEGRGNGKPGRHTQTIDAAEYIRRYGLPKAARE